MQTNNSVVPIVISLTTHNIVHMLVRPESYEYSSSSLLYSSWAYYFWDSAHSYYLLMLQERPPTFCWKNTERCGFASLQQLLSWVSQWVYLHYHLMYFSLSFAKYRYEFLQKGKTVVNSPATLAYSRTTFFGYFAHAQWKSGGRMKRVQSMQENKVSREQSLAEKVRRAEWI